MGTIDIVCPLRVSGLNGALCIYMVAQIRNATKSSEPAWFAAEVGVLFWPGPPPPKRPEYEQMSSMVDVGGVHPRSEGQVHCGCSATQAGIPEGVAGVTTWVHAASLYTVKFDTWPLFVHP